MEFRTQVKVEKPRFEINEDDELLFVGSCFADNIGKRFVENKFRTTVNPFGTMYNPASILHTVERCEASPRVAFFTLGTNHVYVLNSTGEIVDNCQKRPQSLFTEKQLTVEECAGYLRKAVKLLQARRNDVQVVVTVSPIRYAKYGFHESQLSKATLLLAANALESATYFPAYEIMNDELRDYRFYAPDMLHPSEQAVEYLWETLCANYFSKSCRQFLDKWRVVKEGLGHKPFNPDSEQYRQFRQKVEAQYDTLKQEYPHLR